jgi:hypothetical protein
MVSSNRSRRVFAVPLLALTFVLAACGALISIPDATLITDTTGRPDGSLPQADATTQGDASKDDGAIPTCTADLTMDVNNCGACGHDCSKGTCKAGVCTLVKVGKLTGPYGLLVKKGQVYVAEGAGAISSCATEGCDDPTEVVTGYLKADLEPIGIVGDDTFMYWSNVYDGTGGPGKAIVRTPYAGGTSTALTARGGTKPSFEPTALALGMSTLLFGNTDQGPKFIGNPGASPVPAQLTTATPGIDSDYVVAHGAGMYWSDNGVVFHCAALPCVGEPKKVRDVDGTIVFLASTDTYVYFLANFERKLYRCLHSDLTMCEVVRSGLKPARALTVASGNIYIATWDPTDGGPQTGAILRCPESNCTAAAEKTIAAGFGTVQAMVVDGPSVYWTESEGDPNKLDTPGNLMKAPK